MGILDYDTGQVQSMTQFLIIEYGLCFAASINIVAFVILLSIYVSVHYSKQNISKLTLRAYEYGILFMLL